LSDCNGLRALAFDSRSDAAQGAAAQLPQRVHCAAAIFGCAARGRGAVPVRAANRPGAGHYRHPPWIDRRQDDREAWPTRGKSRAKAAILRSRHTPVPCARQVQSGRPRPAMVFKLVEVTEKACRHLDGNNQLPKLSCRREELLRSEKAPIFSYALRSRRSCATMAPSSNETADSSADLWLISPNRNFISKSSVVRYILNLDDN